MYSKSFAAKQLRQLQAKMLKSSVGEKESLKSPKHAKQNAFHVIIRSDTQQLNISTSFVCIFVLLNIDN